MGPLTAGVGHVAVATADLDRLVEFYAAVFDAEITERSDATPRHCFVSIGPGCAIHAFELPERPVPHERRHPWDHGPIDHFTIEAASPDAFATIRGRLRERGVAADTVTDFGSLLSLHFLAPDGLLLELSLWKPEGWEPPFPVTPFTARAGRGGPSG